MDELSNGFYWARLWDGSGWIHEVVEISSNGVMRTGISGRYLQCEFKTDLGPNPKPIEKPHWLK